MTSQLGFCQGSFISRKAKVTGAILVVILSVVFVAYLSGTTLCAQADEAAFFHEQVEPILKKRCYECHSHASGTMEGNLALDWKSGWEVGGDRGKAIIINDPPNSLLIAAINHAQPDLRMPEEKLPANEIDVLTRWIQQGAYDDRVAVKPKSAPNDWWSLKPLIRTSIPNPSTKNPIDAFVTEKLRSAGLPNSERADRNTLIRRIYYDLIGLPPTREEVNAFVADTDPAAYEKLVDKLLSSQRYGEKWARHWFDTIHFADSHGYEHDVGRDNAWRYRDYVIEALNQDKAWGQFIREQLAADYFCPDQPQLTPALGFLGAGTFDLSTYSTATVTFDYLDRDDLVTQTMAAFTSTTANCARCHAHKFDPISQEDYYSIQAVFSGLIKGDVAFDLDQQVTNDRKRLQSIVQATDARDAKELFKPEHTKQIDEWLTAYQQGPKWNSLDLQTFVSTEGATLTRQNDGSLLASGTKPERDLYILTTSTSLEQITALRLDVLPHASLPMNGPGRCENGNLHLSEVELQLFDPSLEQGKSLKIKSATADFNQLDWGIERSIDGDPNTAWGIHPAVGQHHYAVFELAEPLKLTPNSRIVVTLKQLHGRSHLIGALNLFATSQDPTKAKAVPFDVERAINKPVADRTDGDRLAIAAFVLKSWANEAISQLPAKSYVYAAAPSVGIPAGNGQIQLKSLPGPKVVHVLHRGDFDKPRAEVSAGALSVLADLPYRFVLKDTNNEAQRRAALADWIAHKDNVLAWRSIVNRVWHHHFGRGICDTPSDFGRMGGVPSHPELLDWLAVWFRDEANGSLKQLHRMIVTSETYCQSSLENEACAQVDADNRLLWKQNRQRLDADAVRDFTLSASGMLDLQMGGPGVQHFKQTRGIQSTPALDYTVFDWSSPGASRRSIYRYVWRGIADPFMESLDFPDLGLLSPVRGFSASSLQALSLYNNDFVLHHSQTMAKNIEALTSDVGNQVDECVWRAWQRPASADERKVLSEFVTQHGLAELCRVLFNSNEFLFVE